MVRRDQDIIKILQQRTFIGQPEAKNCHILFSLKVYESEEQTHSTSICQFTNIREEATRGKE